MAGVFDAALDHAELTALWPADADRMLAAILGMADRLGLETLAEGVESVGEHALLAQLGCDHVQGFGIARPMPADQIAEWAHQHDERIAGAQRLGRSSG